MEDNEIIVPEGSEIVRKNIITFEDTAFAKNYKKNHKMSDECKAMLDARNPPGTKIVDTISGEVYITK